MQVETAFKSDPGAARRGRETIWNFIDLEVVGDRVTADLWTY